LASSRRMSARSLAAAEWQPQRSPIPIRPSQVRERRGPLAQQDEHPAAEEALGTAALGAATPASARVAPPQLDVALWMLDECETPKRSRSIILDASKRLGFGETPSKRMPALPMPALTPPVHMSTAPLGVAIAPTPCTGVSSPTTMDSWQLRASSRATAQSPVGYKLERQLFAPEAGTAGQCHDCSQVDAAIRTSIAHLSPSRRIQCRGLVRIHYH